MTPDEHKSLRALRREAGRCNCTVTIDRAFGINEVRVTAPQGFILGDVHEFVDAAWSPWQPDYADALDRLKANPPVLCTRIECDWCNDE